MDNIKEKLYQQLAIDYCCPVSDIKDKKNHFTEYEKREGRRQFEEADECILKVIVVNGKLVFTGKKQVVDVCSQKFSDKSGSWFMDVSNFRELDEILAGEGYQIKTVHPFFIPKDHHVCDMNGIEVKNIIRKKFFNSRVMIDLMRHFALMKIHRMCLRSRQL